MLLSSFTGEELWYPFAGHPGKPFPKLLERVAALPRRNRSQGLSANGLQADFFNGPVRTGTAYEGVLT